MFISIFKGNNNIINLMRFFKVRNRQILARALKIGPLKLSDPGASYTPKHDSLIMRLLS